MNSSFKNTESKHEGTSNYKAWKVRVETILERNKVLGIVTSKVTEPSDQTRKEKYHEDNILARSILLDSIRDHLIPYIVEHKTIKAMSDTIIGLYNINNANQSINLSGQLRNIKMTKNGIGIIFCQNISN